MQLGLNGDILAGGHRFHVQTAYSASNDKIISHVFEQGRIITQREVSCHGQLTEQPLSAKIKAVHQEMISETELLFYIAEKVRQVKHVPSRLKLGLIFMGKELIDDAVAMFQLALEADPNSVEAHSFLGNAHARRGEFAQAEERLRRSLALAPDYADSHYYLGAVLLEQGKLSEAMPVFEAALKINPKFAQAQTGLALSVLLTISAPDSVTASLPPALRMKRAQDLLGSVVQNFPGHPQLQQLRSAMELLESKDHAAAAAELLSLRRDTRFEPGFNFEHEFYLKFMYGGKSRDDEFIQQHLERLHAAVQDYPEYPDLHNSLGIAYLIQCRNLFLRALDEFRAALKINPNFKRAEKNLKISENDGKGFLILLRALLK